MKNIPKVILLIENSRSYGRCLLRGIARYSATHGPWAFSRPEAFYMRHGNKAYDIKELKEIGANGIIMRETPNTEEIISLGLPLVLSTYIREKYPNTIQILTENHEIGHIGAQHLIDKGFKNLAFCGDNKFYWSNERLISFQQRSELAGIRNIFIKQTYTKNIANQDEIVQELSLWIKTLPLPIGIMTCSDEYAQFVAEATKISGLKVPEDIAILGVDNDDFICDLTYPTLSSVALGVEQAGYESALILDDLMKNRTLTTESVLVKPLYVVGRHSTDIMAVDIPKIVKSLNYIEENIEKKISVQDVADNVYMSRRSLERLFAKELQRSIYQMVKHIRMKRIIKYLVETDCSAGEISRLVGFPDEAYLSKFFHKEKGISLSKFRKLANFGITE